ncbi:C6 transcription factor [Fusarium sp. NRRL 25303]|nr:C6 transcription factor [Fusarium sp. NRRL 25303]
MPELQVSESHWKQFLEWNRPLRPTKHICIHDGIEAQATAQPTKVAVASTLTSLTYGDLIGMATQIASDLNRRGISPEMIVPLCFDKSPWMIVAMLGVLKAGGAFVALDPKAPTSRIIAIMHQVNAKVVATEPKHRHLFSNYQAIELSDTYDFMLPQTSDNHPTRASHPKDAAYLIFTSGSTGKPKGVVVEHQSFSSGMAQHAKAQFIDRHSRVLQFASYTHDACIVEILTTLCVGGTICSPSEDERVNGLVQFINSQSVNWAVLTLSFIPSIDHDEIPTLENVVLAGERTLQSNISSWAASVKLLSGYGVSECSVVTTISTPADENRSASNIGMPAGGVCWIVDSNDPDKLIPIGEVGEILIEGPTVARGYLGNPEATKSAFIRPPVWLHRILQGPDHSSRLYRTGDLGRYNHDGSLDFVSRIGSQVKVLGRRIELGEIEHHISNHPSVRQCMVQFPSVGAYHNHLVAVLELHNKQCVVPADGSESNDLVPCNGGTHDIESFLRTKVPDYMIPTFWFAIGRFPRLPSAKSDRNKVADLIAHLRLIGGASYGDVPANDAIARKILQRLWGVNIPVSCFMDQTARPTLIANHVRSAQEQGQGEYILPEPDLKSALDGLKRSLDVKITTALARSGSSSGSKLSTLLTGGAGYLGQEILERLLTAGQKVIVLVRACSISEGRERFQTLPWWRADFEDLLEVWLADLSRSNLGVDQKLMERLSGHVQRFVYVSGGSAIGQSVDEWLANARDGYSKTKLLAQALVEHCAVCSADLQLGLGISIVKPGYIIGGPENGVANSSDYLWRYIASVVELGVYDETTTRARVAFSILPLVEEIIVRQISTALNRKQVEIIHDSLQERDIWEVLRSLGYLLRLCDGEKPSCSRCVGRKIDCEYSATDDHRGTVPKAYARHLQARIKLLEDTLRLNGIDVNTSGAADPFQSRSDPTRSILTPNGSSPDRSELSRDSQGMLHFNEVCNSGDDTRSRFFGPTSGCFELQRPDGAPGHAADDGLCSGHSDLDDSTALDLIEPSATLKEHLISCYFEWNNPWCQYVNEDLFRQSERAGGRYSSPFLLNSVLALGSRYSDRSEVRPFTCHPNCAGRRFLAKANSFLHEELKKPTITTIQALAISGIFYVAIGQDAAGWLRHGMAIQLALDMGMNLDSTVLNGSERFPSEEIELRRQVYWALYCDNKLWSSYTGRVCTMLDSNASVNLPTLPQISGSNNMQRLTVDTLQYAMCTHCQILEKIHMNMYAPKRLSDGSQRRSFFESCLPSLKSWFESLPAVLKVPESDGGQNRFPQAYTMLMVHQTSYILLAKPFLSAARPRVSDQIPAANANTTISPTGRAFSICFEAAKAIIWLGERYRQVFGSFRRSPVTASHCTLTAALVMLSASYINEALDQNDIDTLIKSCISILQELSQSWTPARRFCDTIMRIAEGRSTDAMKIGSVPNDSDSNQVSQSSTDARHGAQSVSSNRQASPVMPESCSLSSFVSFGPFTQCDLHAPDISSNNFETEVGLPWENIPLGLLSWYESWEAVSTDLQLS